MTIILGISGSLRRESFNTKLLAAAAQLAPSGTTITAASIRDIPLYDGDVEAEQGAPTAVLELKEQLASADGLLLATPEYNNSLPGVLKNTIDWLSRPASDIARLFGDRPVALMGATPGRGGTMLAQTAWLPVLRTLGARFWAGPRMMVSSANSVFDEAGAITDARVRGQLEQFVHGFVEFISG